MIMVWERSLWEAHTLKRDRYHGLGVDALVIGWMHSNMKS